MRNFYNIYLSLIILLKVCLVALDVYIYYNKYIAHESNADITSLKVYSKKLLAITEAMMFFLLSLTNSTLTHHAALLPIQVKGVYLCGL